MCVLGGGGGGGGGGDVGGWGVGRKEDGTGYNFGWTSSIDAISIPNVNSMIWKAAE